MLANKLLDTCQINLINKKQNKTLFHKFLLFKCFCFLDAEKCDRNKIDKVFFSELQALHGATVIESPQK